MNTRFKVFASYNILQYLCDFIHVLIFITVSKCRKSPKLTNIVIQVPFSPPRQLHVWSDPGMSKIKLKSWTVQFGLKILDHPIYKTRDSMVEDLQSALEPNCPRFCFSLFIFYDFIYFPCTLPVCSSPARGAKGGGGGNKEITVYFLFCPAGAGGPGGGGPPNKERTVYLDPCFCAISTHLLTSFHNAYQSWCSFDCNTLAR
jgi:hypothetical protein